MLLSIQYHSCDVLRNVIFKVVTQDKRNGLAFIDLDASYKALAQHSRPLLLSEGNDGAAVLVIALINSDIELKLDVLAVKGCHFTLLYGWRMCRLANGGHMRILAIAKGRKDFNV